jgi:hypothetical protein
MSRFVYTTYCDDVRLEVNGKASLMGVYADAMYVQGFPVNLTKFCVVVNAVTPAGNPFKGFKITALYNDPPIAAMEVPAEQLQEEIAKAPTAPIRNVQAQMIFAPLLLDKAGELTILFESEGETIESNPLQVLIAPEGIQLVLT